MTAHHRPRASGVDTTVVRANAADAAALSQVIAEAFHDLAPSRWLISDPDARARIFPAYFRLYVERALATGIVYTTPSCAAVALWLPVGHDGPQPLDGGYLAGLTTVTGPWADRFVIFDVKLDRHHPAGTAHDHLAVLAVRPHVQGNGIGTALLCAHHATLDQTGIPGYLEASSRQARALYLRHGYADHGPAIWLPHGPALFPMWRPAAPQNRPSSPESQVTGQQSEPSLADVQAEFPNWQCSRGNNGLYYARHQTTGQQVCGEDPLDLRDQIKSRPHPPRLPAC